MCSFDVKRQIDEFDFNVEVAVMEYQEWLYEIEEIVYKGFEQLEEYGRTVGFESNEFLSEIKEIYSFNVSEDVKYFISEELHLTSARDIIAFIKGMNFYKFNSRDFS